MSLYGTLITESNNIITNEEFNQLRSDLLEVTIDLNEYYESLDEQDEIFVEGANIDMMNIFNSHKKSIIDNIRFSKKKLRRKEFSEAKSYLAKANTELKKMESDIKKIESTTGSVYFGLAAAILLNASEILCPVTYGILNLSVADLGITVTKLNAMDYAEAKMLNLPQETITKIAKNVVGSASATAFNFVVGIANEIIAILTGLIRIIKTLKQVKKDKEESASKNNTANAYRNLILSSCTDLQKNIDKIMKTIEKREKIKDKEEK